MLRSIKVCQLKTVRTLTRKKQRNVRQLEIPSQEDVLNPYVHMMSCKHVRSHSQN